MRTSLLPGLLKTIRENRSHALPLRIFETSDVVFKDVARERQARNVRHAAAVWCNKTAGFEIVHGLLDRAMAMLEVPHMPGGGAGGEAGSQAALTRGYYLKERNGASVSRLMTNLIFSPMLLFCLLLVFISGGLKMPDPTFFPGRAATIYYRAGSTDAIRDGKDVEIGRLGILHPSVLEKFEIGYPCSALEFSLEPFKAKMPAMWTNDDI